MESNWPIQQLLQGFCSASSCSWSGNKPRADGAPPPEKMPSSSDPTAKDASQGGLLDALSLKPSIVDDGEIFFPPRWQGRAPPRGSSAPRQKSGRPTAAARSQGYTAADFQDLPIGNAGPLRMSNLQAEFQDGK
eukprot:TRINITY_DN98737_c0_g1_i1.p1 TRINITY_DN98737_c0_g1~~TRINITY_DN98737_c0_g1_i1.p1  ORF type:complete len:134 (-),score=14.85 TRINITY_DN98737_c0_g1_i1:229-630(-)